MQEAGSPGTGRALRLYFHCLPASQALIPNRHGHQRVLSGPRSFGDPPRDKLSTGSKGIPPLYAGRFANMQMRQEECTVCPGHTHTHTAQHTVHSSHAEPRGQRGWSRAAFPSRGEHTGSPTLTSHFFSFSPTSFGPQQVPPGKGSVVTQDKPWRSKEKKRRPPSLLRGTHDSWGGKFVPGF